MIHSKGKYLLRLGVLTWLLTPLCLQATPAKADGWVIECVDCPKQFSNMTDRSLRLDAAGHPHIAYGEDHLYYAWHDGASWHYETVDDAPEVGTHTSLALDGDGYPHISYFDESDNDLKYAYYQTSYQIYLPLVAKDECYGICNFHLSESCDGPARTEFPIGTPCIYVVFDHYELEVWHVTISLWGNGINYVEIGDCFGGCLVEPGTFCAALCAVCEDLNVGTYTVSCSVNGHLVDQQTFTIMD